MKRIRLFTSILAVALLVALSTTALAGNIYELVEESNVANGIVRKNIKRLTTDGWQNINVIETDLSTGRYGIKTLTNTEELSKLANVQNLAQQHGTFAAVNGDFFSWKWDDNSRGSAIGGVYADGEMLTSQTSPWNFATVAQTIDGAFIFDYIDCNITLSKKDGTNVIIEHINKYDDLSKPIVYTKEWGEYSPGSGGTQMELVVEDGRIKSVNADKGPAKIPHNGYVVAFLSDLSPEMLTKFRAGDDVEMKVDYKPAFSDIHFAVGAGTLLLKDGQRMPIINELFGNQPRTVIGTNADNTKFYMVTVDGRQENAKGVDLLEMTEILLDLGIANAANLDGGGSTTMVINSAEAGGQTVVNSTSDSYLRPVANGVGIVPAKPADDKGFITINPDTDTVFLGTTTYLNAKVHDSYGNIKDVNDVIWVTAGGEINDGYYTPYTVGKHTVTASWGGFSATKEIRVSATPVQLRAGHKVYSMGIGESAYISLIAIDKDGYKSYINLNDADIYVSSDILEIDGNNIKGVEKGSTVVTFAFNGVQTSVAVRVDDDTSIISIPEDVSFPFIDELPYNPDNAFRLAVFGSTSDKSTLLKRLVLKKYTDILNSNVCDMAVFTDVDADIPEGLKTKALNISGFNALSFDDALVIAMDNGNFKHWSKLINELKAVKKKNVFLVLPESVVDDIAYQEEMLSDIADKQEIKLHIISSGSGDIISSLGIRHITVPGLETVNSAGNVTRDAQYRIFTVVNGKVYCETYNMY